MDLSAYEASKSGVKVVKRSSPREAGYIIGSDADNTALSSASQFEQPTDSSYWVVLSQIRECLPLFIFKLHLPKKHVETGI
jgi:hypothetical protein